MAKRILNVIESAYRGTLEEQDDTVVWITHAMKGAGADLGVLLRGAAVNYAVRGQDASGLAFGDKRQTQPPRVAEDLAALVAKGVEVRVLQEDAQERGLAHPEMVEGMIAVRSAELPRLFETYDQVWCW
jgi:hypothetical protein